MNELVFGMIASGIGGTTVLVVQAALSLRFRRRARRLLAQWRDRGEIAEDDYWWLMDRL